MIRSRIDAETVTRLCALAFVVPLISFGAVQPAAAVGDEEPAVRGDTVPSDAPADAADTTVEQDDTDQGEAAGGDALTLSISPKRALVSLAFLGALLARRHRDSAV
ncbi:hypothetical protein [Halobacterium bonnevillei]|uniref:Uncharacterized protein n=1 Tax=Halobacterium bonnevillei TaxID=2692200 RepID=A0A6B0SR44_9EURY|nr:hypothetical protein [Halobacterium bonnevillei]MXR22043.1 hypothetical protein [Halobacterium bonnevillei]